jgi:hypothetical protein
MKLSKILLFATLLLVSACDNSEKSKSNSDKVTTNEGLLEKPIFAYKCSISFLQSDKKWPVFLSAEDGYLKFYIENANKTELMKIVEFNNQSINKLKLNLSKNPKALTFTAREKIEVTTDKKNTNKVEAVYVHFKNENRGELKVNKNLLFQVFDCTVSQ